MRPDPKSPNQHLIDVHLAEKFPHWKEPFMYRLLQQYKIYQKEGLIIPEEVKQATQEYKDTITPFIEDRLESNHGSYLTMKEIWYDYQNSEFCDKKIQNLMLKQALKIKLGNKCIIEAYISGIHYRSFFKDWRLRVANTESKL